MRYKIRGDEEINLTLCENDKVTSVLQNIHLILTTRKGSVPMYREFGLDMDFIDKPIPVAQTLMVSRVRDALEKFEPRAEFADISFEYNESFPGGIIPILEVDINE